MRRSSGVTAVRERPFEKEMIFIVIEAKRERDSLEKKASAVGLLSCADCKTKLRVHCFIQRNGLDG